MDIANRLFENGFDVTHDNVEELAKIGFTNVAIGLCKDILQDSKEVASRFNFPTTTLGDGSIVHANEPKILDELKQKQMQNKKKQREKQSKKKSRPETASTKKDKNSKKSATTKKKKTTTLPGSLGSPEPTFPYDSTLRGEGQEQGNVQV